MLLAETGRAGFAVLGRHGAGGANALPAASTAYEVVGHTPHPVVIVPEGRGRTRGPVVTTHAVPWRWYAAESSRPALSGGPTGSPGTASDGDEPDAGDHVDVDGDDVVHLAGDPGGAAAAGTGRRRRVRRPDGRCR